MKVLMVNKFLYPAGGAETYMINLGECLLSRGHQVEYFGMADSRNVVGNRWDAYAPNVDFHSDRSGPSQRIRQALDSIYSPKACMEIRRVLERFQPDIVHFNNINFQLTPAILYEVRRQNIPMIWTVHDPQIACPCHRFYIESEGKICERCGKGNFLYCVKNKCLQNSLSKSVIAALESYYYHLRRTYHLVDLYLCPSEFIQRKMMVAGLKESRTLVLYNYANKSPDMAKLAKKEKYILYFGRLSREKGVLSLLRVCARLPEVTLLIAGTGPLEDTVREKAQQYTNIQYVGYKKDKELRELIANAAFCVLPSEWYENCPMSVVESQALGTPVIGSDLGGTKELIRHNHTGLIYKGGDNERLQWAICKLWEDETRLEQMRQECKENLWMGLEEYTDRIVEIYQKFKRKEGD